MDVRLKIFSTVKFYNMTQLFRQEEVADYFKELEQIIQNQIDRYKENHLLELDIEETVEELFEEHEQRIPVIHKDDITWKFSTTQMSGYDFPSGITFTPGKVYDVEYANYTIPFSGDSVFFKSKPKNPSTGWSMQADLKNSSLVLSLTRYGKLQGNNQALEEVRTQLINHLGQIEIILKQLQNDCDDFNQQLKPFIKAYLEKKISDLKTKNDSLDKLNPFN